MSIVWNAKWIGPAYDPRQDVGVFCFRRRLQVATVPKELTVRVSADQRYRLYVNGQQVVFGPQRGDARHWFFETIDLAPYLVEGENWIAAMVWNFGWMAPMAQMSVRTAFLLDGPDLGTPDKWQVSRIEGWDFDMMHNGVGQFYIDVGPGEIIDATLLPWGFLTGADALGWQTPNLISHAEGRGANGGGTPWMLVPRSIPDMRYEARDRQPVVRDDYSTNASKNLNLEPGCPLLLDYQELLCAYPRFAISGPAGAVITATYDEALWDDGGGKGNRDEVAGKHSKGYQDKFILDGNTRTFEPLWWRTYRYILLQTDAPATIDSVDAMETGYPLSADSTFEADDPWVKPIWDVSLRTAERCAGETYFDCPYYEQLQYVGDTRIQALIGYYLGPDRALQRNAVETLGWSLMENGLTQSRYPSRQTQVIPPFSLWWVLMLYDQMLYDAPGSQPDFASVNTISRILGRYRKLSKEEGQFWQFADWVPSWRWGVPPGAAMSLVHQLLLHWAHYASLSLKQHWEGKPHVPVDTTFWRDVSRFSISYPPGLTGTARMGINLEPSEHAEALHRLIYAQEAYDAAPDWPGEALEASDAAKCTYYFAYYKHLAMQPDDYMAQLGPWKEMIENGLTTFAENPEPVRSDCHAWSAHPILGFFQIVAGVTSTAPGWAMAKIEPRPGSLRRFDAQIAHPNGRLRVLFEDGKLEIETPVPAQLVWQNNTERLEPGTHRMG